MIRAFILALLVAAPVAAGERDDLLARVPQVDDSQVREVYEDPATIWYTDEEMPPAYQHDTDVSGQTSFHNPQYDISGGADAKGKLGNGNNEFPWHAPGGTDRAKVRSLKAICLPKIRGRLLPIICFRDSARVVRGPTHIKHRLSWRFPVGTRFLELLYLDGPDGNPWCFEVRMRRRLPFRWETSVFRPVPTRDDLLDDFSFSRVHSYRDRVVARHPREVVFDVEAGWEVLPLFEPGDVARLLSRPFTEATGVNWSEDAAAPTSVQDFSLVPRGYDGTLVGNDSDACARCHEHVGRHVANMDPTRDWYGFIRGSDGIFSFLPIDPSSISRSGERRPVRLRADLVQAGYLSTDTSAMGSEYYTPLEGDDAR